MTTCTYRRRRILTSSKVAAILREEWLATRERYGWVIGRYVIMPDHVHFFCAAEVDAKPLAKLMQAWKQWTSRRITRELELGDRIWQAEFFDHVLRSTESYSQKWDYVRENPVRAGFVDDADHWPWQGEIDVLML